MHFAEIGTGQEMPDSRDGGTAMGLAELSLRIRHVMRNATELLAIRMTRPGAGALGESVRIEDLDPSVVKRVNDLLGTVNASRWSCCQCAAAFYVEAILMACPKLIDLLDRGPNSDTADIYIGTNFPHDPFEGFTLKVTWPHDKHPLNNT